MQNWPYAEFAHINVEYFRNPQKNNPAKTWEHLTVDAIFVSENAVLFFDHHANQYKKQRSELDEYLEDLGTDGWRLTSNSWFEGKAYQFRRYLFRRAIE